MLFHQCVCLITQVHNDACETGGNKQARLLPHEHNPGRRERKREGFENVTFRGKGISYSDHDF